MRISDWSSDVCSSDLPHAEFDRFPQRVTDLVAEFGTKGIDAVIEHFIEAEHADFHWDGRLAEMNLGAWESLDEEDGAFERVASIGYFRRSEEHTSELQSLMRISYAVFCLKKKHKLDHTLSTVAPPVYNEVT